MHVNAAATSGQRAEFAKFVGSVLAESPMSEDRVRERARCPPTLPVGDARAAHGTPGHPFRSLRSRLLPEPDRRQGAQARRCRRACGRPIRGRMPAGTPALAAPRPRRSRPISCSSGSPATPMLRPRRRWPGCGARRCCSTRSCRSRRRPRTVGRLDGWVKSQRLELEDRVACRLADRVLVDTDAHAEHFATRARHASVQAPPSVGRAPTTT